MLTRIRVLPLIAAWAAGACGGAKEPVRTASKHSAASSSGSLAFDSANFEWTWASDPAVAPHHIWITDDIWAESFFAVGVDSTTHMQLTLMVDENTFVTGRLNANVLLNGTVVGNLTLGPESLGNYTYDFYYDQIAGPDYRLEIRATNTVTDGGCVSIAIDGPTYAIID